MGSPVRENLLNNIAVIYFCATRGGSLEAQLVRVGEGRDVADRDEGGLALEQGRGSLSHTRTDMTIRNLTAAGGDEAVTLRRTLEYAEASTFSRDETVSAAEADEPDRIYEYVTHEYKVTDAAQNVTEGDWCTHLRAERRNEALPGLERRRSSELGLRNSLLEVVPVQRARGLERLNSSLAGGLDVRGRRALDEEPEERRIRVGEEDRADRGARRDLGGDGRRALRPLHGGRRVEVRREDGKLSRGRASGAEPNEDGLRALMRVQAGLAPKVARGLRGGGGRRPERLAERLLEELLERAGVDAGAEDGDVALPEDGLGVRLDVVGGDVVAGGGEDGVAEAGAEGEGVGELEGARRGVGEGGGALGLADGGDPLLELVAGELGRGQEGGEDVDEECSGERIVGWMKRMEDGSARKSYDMAGIVHSLVAAQELRRDCQVLPGET